MANLIQRIVLGTDGKIPIHAFCGAFNEYQRGKITSTTLINMFDLDSEQVDQAIILNDLLGAAPNKTEFMRVFKDLLYMGESDVGADYKSIVFYLTRLQAEVTDQGGTLP